jgi:hypothetical protein
MDPMVIAGINLGVGLALLYIAWHLHGLTRRQQQIGDQQRELQEALTATIQRLESSTPAQLEAALVEIRSIKAGLNGVSRPLIRSLWNTVEPAPPVNWIPMRQTGFDGRMIEAVMRWMERIGPLSRPPTRP